MNANRNSINGLRTKAHRVTTALEQLEAAHAVLQPLIEAPLAPKIPKWFPEVVNQKMWNMRNKFETELTRLDQQLEKAANAANRANATNRANGPAMYPELTDVELSVLENEIQYLIKDAKVLQSDDDDCPAFTQVEFKNAVEVGDADVVHLLLHDPTIDPSANNNVAIRNASRYGETELVKVLLADPRVDPSAGNNSAIRNASLYGETELVKVLLAHPRVDPSAMGDNAIRFASLTGNLDIVKMLLADHRVDPSTDNNYAIRMASAAGHTNVVKVLLAHPRVDPSADNNEAIYIASLNGSTDLVELLLERREVVAKGLSQERIAKGKTEAIRKLLREKLTAVGGRRTRRPRNRRQSRR